MATGHRTTYNPHISIPHQSVSIYFSGTFHHRNSTRTRSPRYYLSHEPSHVAIGPVLMFEIICECQQVTFDTRLPSNITRSRQLLVSARDLLITSISTASR